MSEESPLGLRSSGIGSGAGESGGEGLKTLNVGAEALESATDWALELSLISQLDSGEWLTGSDSVCEEALSSDYWPTNSRREAE